MIAKFLLDNNIKKFECPYPDFEFDTVIRNPKMIDIDLDALTLPEIVSLNVKSS